MTVRFYSSIAQQTTLTGTYSPSTTVIAVAATTGFPSSTPYTLALDYGFPNEELVDVTAVAGLSLTVTRAVDGTSATTHAAGAIVRHVSSARDFADSRAHENASTNVHGIAVGSAVVGTTDAQTLTNKTLGAGTTFSGAFTLNNPNITGTVTGSATYNTPTLSGAVALNGSVAASNQLDVKGASGQSGALQRWLSNGGTVLASINSAGTFVEPNGVNITTTNTLQVPIFVKGPASMASPYLDIQDSTAADLVTVDSTGKFSSLKGTFLVGDPSPGTGGVTMKAGPSATRVAEFQNAAGVAQVTVDNVGLLTTQNLTILGEPAWTVFTPLWTSSGAAPAIGNGTLTGGYRQHGRTITVRWFWQAGSTTTFGTGTWFFSFPSGKPHVNLGGNQAGTGSAFGSRSTFRNGTAQADPSDFTRIRISDSNVGTLWGTTVPATWASGDYINVTMTYETDNSI